MSILKIGQRCVIVAGCPENIGLIVKVLQRLGAYEGRPNAYYIETVSGRPFYQLWAGNDLVRGTSHTAITDRHKLRPLVDPKDKVAGTEVTVPRPQLEAAPTPNKVEEVEA